MGVLPNTTTANQVLRSKGSGGNDAYWGSPDDLATDNVLVIAYPIRGAIEVASGGTDYQPPFNIHVPAGQTCMFTGVCLYTRVGACTVDITQNGTGITGLTGITVTSTPTVFTPTDTVTVADGDAFAIVVDSV